MKFVLSTAILAISAVSAVAVTPCPSSITPTPTTPKLTYYTKTHLPLPSTSTLATNGTITPLTPPELERLVHIKLFLKRLPNVTAEEFYEYWATGHLEIVADFHVRVGVRRYIQYHALPSLREPLLLPNGTSILPLLDYDGAAEFWVPSLETFLTMGADPEYVNVIQPDEANFIDLTSLKVVVGADWVVVEGGKKVVEHGREW